MLGLDGPPVRRRLKTERGHDPGIDFPNHELGHGPNAISDSTWRTSTRLSDAAGERRTQDHRLRYRGLPQGNGRSRNLPGDSVDASRLELQIVRQHQVTVLTSPTHDHGVRRLRTSNRRPMDGLNTLTNQEPHYVVEVDDPSSRCDMGRDRQPPCSVPRNPSLSCLSNPAPAVAGLASSSRNTHST